MPRINGAFTHSNLGVDRFAFGVICPTPCSVRAENPGDVRSMRYAKRVGHRGHLAKRLAWRFGERGVGPNGERRPDAALRVARSERGSGEKARPEARTRLSRSCRAGRPRPASGQATRTTHQ